MGSAPSIEDLRLENHEASIEHLDRLMKRMDAGISRVRFLEAVTTTFQDVQGRLMDDPLDQRFRSEPSHGDFRAALQAARADFTQKVAVLVIGCGRGVAGQPAAFAASVVEEIFDRSELDCIEEYDLTSRSLECDMADFRAGSRPHYSLIVMHSVLHYMRSIAPMFALIRSLLSHPGGLVLSHEPNARFWLEPACCNAVQELNRSRKRRKALRHLKLARYLKALAGAGSKRTDLLAALNAELRSSLGFKEDLSEVEMRRIVDIHRPTMGGGDFKIGLDGFDLERLVAEHLPAPRLKWAATSGHLGYANPRDLPGHWRRRGELLKLEYPLSGCLFSGYWMQA